MSIQNALFMQQFFADNTASGDLTPEISTQIEQLWNEYKLPSLQDNCSIITAKVGKLGSIVIRKIVEFDKPVEFKYESGNYDYVSIKANPTKIILWTDYSTTEPYNRQGGLYANGSSFESLGQPVLEKEDYREFQATDDYTSNISFGVWGYNYNNFYNSVRFGMCISTDKVDEFIIKLRLLLNK